MKPAHPANIFMMIVMVFGVVSFGGTFALDYAQKQDLLFVFGDIKLLYFICGVITFPYAIFRAIVARSSTTQFAFDGDRKRTRARLDYTFNQLKYLRPMVLGDILIYKPGARIEYPKFRVKVVFAYKWVKLEGPNNVLKKFKDVYRESDRIIISS